MAGDAASKRATYADVLAAPVPVLVRDAVRGRQFRQRVHGPIQPHAPRGPGTDHGAMDTPDGARTTRPGDGRPDPFHLERFVRAQDAGGTFDRALAELRAGRKRSHWMWFVLPQPAGLGTSPTSVTYAISGRDEALAYLAHPVLGPRLRACLEALDALPDPDPIAVLGPVDALKLRSCLTLFATASLDEARFEDALARFYPQGPDEATLELLKEKK